MRCAAVGEEAEKALLIEYPCSSWKDERSLDLIVGEPRDCQRAMFPHSVYCREGTDVRRQAVGDWNLNAKVSLTDLRLSCDMLTYE